MTTQQCKTWIVALAMAFLLPTLAPVQMHAQGWDQYKNGLRLYLNNDSTSFIRLLMWSQIWTRFQEQNPLTTVNTNSNVDNTWDVGIRRSRILLHGQVTPRILVFWIVGANNQTFINGGGSLLTGPDGQTDGKRQPMFVHDAWTEFKVSRELHLGAGLLTWSGLSRMSNAATLNFLTLDSPLYGWAILDATDQFARTFGVYAKGEIGKFNYRAILSKPFAIPAAATGWTAPTMLQRSGAAPMTTLSGRGAGWAAGFIGMPNAYNIAQWSGRTLNQPLYQGYANYDFFEQESSTLPFMVGSYLGSKKVFNIGAGFMIHPDAMWSRQIRGDNPGIPTDVTLNDEQRNQLLNERRYPTTISGFGQLPEAQRISLMSANVDTVDHDMRLFSVDAFLDLPFGSGDRKSALTAHAAYYWMNYGPNYVRNAASMNVATATSVARPGEQATFNGPGTAYPIWGTGQVFHMQAGYLLPKAWTRRFGRWQPYASVSHVNFNRLNDQYTMLEGGINCILAGQNAKITLHYRPRPLYTPAATEVPGQELLGGMRRTGNRGEWVLQTFIYL